MTGLVTPVRIQLSRAKGFNLQAASLALNGLPAVNVARPSRWGNPYRIAPAFEDAGVKFPEITRDSAVKLHREWLEHAASTHPSVLRSIRVELGGRNLACWCAPGALCHGDTLLSLANAFCCVVEPRSPQPAQTSQ